MVSEQRNQYVTSLSYLEPFNFQRSSSFRSWHVSLSQTGNRPHDSTGSCLMVLSGIYANISCSRSFRYRPLHVNHPQLDANVPQKWKHAIQCWKFGSLWLRKGASSNSSNVDWICGLSVIAGEKIVGCWGFFSPTVTAPYTYWRLSHTRRKKVVQRWSTVSSLLEENPSSVVWGSSGKCRCVCLLLSVVLSGQLLAGGSFSFSWPYPTVNKKISHIAYLLNFQFALKDSQAEPERIWEAWINFLQLQVPSDDSLL